MSYRLPDEMRDRWANRPDLPDDQFSLYWHVLLGSDNGVRAAALTTQSRVAHLPGLHLTPAEWLHLTIEAIGPARHLDPSMVVELSASVRERLGSVEAFEVHLQTVLYHPEAIVLMVQPTSVVAALRDRVKDALYAVMGRASDGANEQWVPHVTVAYSTMQQPVDPLVDALGHEIVPHRFLIEKVSLVEQWGPEREWAWRIADEVPLQPRAEDASSAGARNPTWKC